VIVFNAFWKRSLRLAALLLAVCTAGSLPSFVEPVEADDGTYYRLKVKLAYKGEPQDFDVVVGCKVRLISYKGGSGNTYEAGLVPTVFGRRMSDGKGLVVRPPNACNGETTANGQVQPDLLPIVVVYDDADTLDFGTAYLSEDAYESPLSVLQFGGATIEKATRSEFEEFRKTQPNLVSREAYFSAKDSDDGLKAKHFTRVRKPLGLACHVFSRFRLPEEVRAIARKYWPAARPTYWRPDTYEAQREITREIWRRPRLQSDGQNDPLRSWSALNAFTDRGLPTRKGGGLVASSRGNAFPPAFYPVATDYMTYRWPADWRQWPSFIAGKDMFVTSDLNYRGGRMRGFAYCGADIRLTSEQEPIRRLVDQKTKVYRVDGQTVISKLPAGNLGDTWIFDRDEAVFHHFYFGLDSTRGDV